MIYKYSANEGCAGIPHFSKTYTRVNAYEDTEVVLPRDGVAVWSLYPITVDENGEEFVSVGAEDKYVPIASRNQRCVKVSALF